ncbi:unnamed protein product [Ectocarpus sp. 12 AP-2014]
MPKKLGRVGDMSPNGAFERCLVYRIDVSHLLEDKSERPRLFQELFAFRLCTEPRPRQDHLLSPVRVHTCASGQPLNGWDNLLEYSRLPYSVKFLIECLTSSLKIDPFGVNKEAVSLLAMAGEERACLALSSMLSTDPRARLEDTPSQEILRWLEGYGPYNGAVYGVGDYGKESGNVMRAPSRVNVVIIACGVPAAGAGDVQRRHEALRRALRQVVPSGELRRREHGQVAALAFAASQRMSATEISLYEMRHRPNCTPNIPDNASRVVGASFVFVVASGTSTQKPTSRTCMLLVL